MIIWSPHQGNAPLVLIKAVHRSHEETQPEPQCKKEKIAL